MARRGAGARVGRLPLPVGRGVACTAVRGGRMARAASAMAVTATAPERRKASPFDLKTVPGHGPCKRWRKQLPIGSDLRFLCGSVDRNQTASRRGAIGTSLNFIVFFGGRDRD